MKEHILEEPKETVEDWQKNNYINYLYSDMKNGSPVKVLRTSLAGIWQVLIDDKIKYQGKDVELAIKYYNRFIS